MIIENELVMNVPIASQMINFPGYGMFWVANSISSTLMGWKNRQWQKEAQEKNLEFEIELERARTIVEDQKLQEEIAFKRRMIAVSRQYRQKESLEMFNRQMKMIELEHYLQYCWPLDPALPDILLNEIEEGDDKKKLNVILLHAPLLPTKRRGEQNDQDAALYKALEYQIRTEDIPVINDICYREGAANKDQWGTADITGGNANIMNIHFLMSQLPTLVISPQYCNGRMFLNGAVWEPQTARPLIRPLLNYEYNPDRALENPEYQQQMIGVFHASISTITGAVRDSYMLITQGKKPTLSNWLNDDKHKEMKRIVVDTPCIKQFLKKENENIIAALDESNSPHLLETFSKKDIEAMKDQVKSNLR